MLGLSFRGLASFRGLRGSRGAGDREPRSATDPGWSSGRGKPRIGFLFGTRPEAIKLAPAIDACRRGGVIDPVVCVTAQHRVLLDQVLDAFSIRPHEDLNLMR